MNDSLIDDILKYMNDADARYAIALEGDWGSGKTRFCEGALKEALDEEGYAVLRISLLGIVDVDALYTRLAMALVHLGSSEGDDRGRKLAKDLGSLIVKGGIAFGKKLLDEQGVTVEATPQMLASLLGKKQLLVLDDLERSGFCSGQALSDDAQATNPKAIELFGAINSLVDGQNCKVMFVTNNFSTINPDIKEKLVWTCLRFDPEPEELAKAIILPKLTSNTKLLDLDIEECVCHASAVAHCTNARAMIEAARLLNMAFETDAARDPKVDKDNREAALCDFVRFSLIAAMGNAPKRPTERQENTHPDYEHANKIIAYKQYTQLDVIESFFDPKKDVTREDVNECLARYISSRYAGSPETMRLRHILEEMRSLESMDDTEVAALAASLSHCIRCTDFDLSYLCEAIQANWTLRNWGFEEAIPSEEILIRAKTIVNAKPEAAYWGIHGKYTHWKDEWSGRYGNLMDDLDAYATEVYTRLMHEKLSNGISPDSPRAGEQIADIITQGWEHGEDLFLNFDPRLVANCFVNGDATSQAALYDMSMRLENRAVCFADERAEQWVSSLLDELRGSEPKTRMGRVRTRWIIEPLEKLINHMHNHR